MYMQGLILFLAVVMLLYTTFWWALATRRLNNSYADIAWGTNFLLIGLAVAIYSGQIDLSFLLVYVPVIIWGSRLAYHIGKRNLSEPEDRRYAEWRQAGGKNYQFLSLFKIFWLQGLLALVISAPIIIAGYYGQNSLSIYSVVGLVIWLAGFIFEALADKQLKNFIKTKRPGQIMTTGLWKHSRHPNYFGEIVQWVGLFVAVVGLCYGWVAVISPLMISFLLIFVSGIPLAEKNFKDNKDFQNYAKVTSALIPLPPKVR